MVLLLAFLYPSVLVPTRSELAFRIFRESKVQGCLHQHLKNALKTLAFNQHSSVRAGAFQGKVITPLFTYQTEAVQRLLQAGSLDASSLGAGKTLVAISFCMFLAAQHSGGEFLVLVPSSSLMDGWRQQIEQHTEGVRVQMQQENGVLREVWSRACADNVNEGILIDVVLVLGGTRHIRAHPDTTELLGQAFAMWPMWRAVQRAVPKLRRFQARMKSGGKNRFNMVRQRAAYQHVDYVRQLEPPRPYRSTEVDPRLWSSKEEIRTVFGYPEITRQPTETEMEKEIKLRAMILPMAPNLLPYRGLGLEAYDRGGPALVKAIYEAAQLQAAQLQAAQLQEDGTRKDEINEIHLEAGDFLELPLHLSMPIFDRLLKDKEDRGFAETT
eukprot:s2550_g6.t1